MLSIHIMYIDSSIYIYIYIHIDIYTQGARISPMGWDGGSSTFTGATLRMIVGM